MATQPIGAESAPVIHPATIPPAPAVMAILDRFNREELGNTIEVLVALLDIWDGDSDGEDDDPAGQYDEDCYTGTPPKGDGPGCLISDSDYEHDGQEPDTGGHVLNYGIDQTQMPQPHWFIDRSPA